MSDLDKKLLDAIYQGVSLNKLKAVPKDSTNWFKATSNGDVYEFVIDPEPIKQAFKDVGYFRPPDDYLDVRPVGDGENPVYKYIEGKGSSFVISGDINKVVECIKDDFKLMTGREWYDRYDHNLRGKIFAFDENGSERIIAAVNACDAAAKKAAGIE